MAKPLLYVTRDGKWVFVFWGTDYNENRAHVHVSFEGTENYCKIWLEPEVEVAKTGGFSQSDLNLIVAITKKEREKLIKQWGVFKKGVEVETIIVKTNDKAKKNVKRKK